MQLPHTIVAEQSVPEPDRSNANWPSAAGRFMSNNCLLLLFPSLSPEKDLPWPLEKLKNLCQSPAS